MGNLSEELMAELNCETAFTIPIFGGIPVAESVVVTWIIMAVLIVAAFFLGRNLKVENVRRKRKKVYSLYDDSWNLHCNLKHDWSVWTEITN